MKIPLLVIAGPTGVGKTATAVALAGRVDLEVISADSRQVYRGMDLATGKPSAAERRAVAHHLVDIVDPDDRYHAARFRSDARRLIAAIRGRGRLPAVVGGTGLYIRALLRGLDPAPPADPELRRELTALAARQGRQALHARLVREAPALALRLHPNDYVRVMRALERIRTGNAVATEQVEWRRRAEEYDVVWVGLTMERGALRRRLGERAAAMVAGGLADEVRGLLARGYDPSLPSMQGIGYREFARVAQGTLAEAEALRLMQRDTMRYAKRQWTWFTREPDIQWLDLALAGGPEGAAGMLERRLREGGLIG
ncbi:MAG TPA: tRNA (adenosine(37)-N6)-dimethylallyltransferase MiaA [Methylomirabilota bacterium]|jgi:tRNA dimethylallyltransferase|nr:tRNA (adenosine(37)-N6)-dimethylallyltransferase MiaA [Methylomirabilota bacterium]